MSSVAHTDSVHSAHVLDEVRIRELFPILAATVGDKPLVYLDNAATTQKPQPVLDTLSRYYAAQNANIHRGVYQLSQNATQAYEDARAKVATFLHAADPAEIIFTRNATEGINLVAQTFGRSTVGEGDEVVISTMEHHSNIVPWQLLCNEKGARLRVVPITDAGELMLDEYESLLGPRTKLVSIVHMSNSLGTVNPVQRVVELAHGHNIPVLIDGSQAAYHMAVDVQAIGCDFYVVTGHKLYGPTGIGALYGRRHLLDAMPPYQGGGDMISSVTFERTTYNEVPHKFEAGTPHIAGAIGLGAAVDFISGVGFGAIAAHERRLLDHATAALSAVPGLRLIGTARQKASILSFVLDGVHAHDIGTIVDTEGVAIRTGHHCTQPVMDRFGVPATARASLAMYNTTEEIDRLVAALTKVREIFG
jgi:cysteine desulfurase/selenocysteine lyase|tara:strand:+ start:256 stop:1515 length:1260 start_codon:yes stop_codon:yes gene_type:complete